MKQYLSKALALLLLVALLGSLLPTVVAQTGKVESNSAKRHTLCTSLSAQAESYYTGAYTYEALSSLAGAKDVTDSYAATQNNPLYTALSGLMSETHTNRNVVYSGYSSNALATYWKKTDTENRGSTYLYFYTDIAANDPSVSGVTMNREHIWPKSRASFYQTGGGADLHHLRPSISSVNMAKSNYAFANLVGTGTSYTPCQVNGRDIIWTGSKDGVGGVLEVRDEIKGDVARIMLYVYVRWQQPNLYSKVAQEHLPPMDKDDDQSNGQQVFESLDTLLAWMELDPVDEWEMARNDQVENVQGNRNVFIDYPELAFLMFGKEIPSDMTTPSGIATEEQPCTHPNLRIEVIAPTCTAGGCTLCTCPDCGEVSRENEVAALGHSYKNGICIRCGEAKPVNYDSFWDLEEDGWYRESIEYALEHKLMKGTTKRTFEPNSPLTRAMLVTILYRQNEEPDVEGLHNPFADVPEGEWYTDAVIWAASKGIVNGTSETTFEPETNITREQIATILYRYSGAKGTAKALDFPDAKSVSDYAKAPMTWAVAEGIIGGSNGYLLPLENATRAECAKMLYGFLTR